MTSKEDLMYGLLFIAAAMAINYAIIRRKALRNAGNSVRDRLDSVLLHWSKDDPFTLRDLLNGGVIVMGRTGSGKTSSSGKAIANGIVRHAGSGGLILAAKPEDRAMWEGIFRSAGRSDDLLVFSPDHPLRFNMLDWENLTGGGHTRNITKCVMVIGETLRSSDTTAGENADFWQRESERCLYNCVEIVKQATGKVSAPALQAFITTAAMHPSVIGTAEWQARFHNQCLKAAFERQKSPTEQHDFDLARDYWLSEWPNMADKTRSSISVSVLGILHVMNTGIVRELLSTTTNVTPADMFRGKWVYVDASPTELGDVGSFISSSWKYAVQKTVLRRHATESSNPVCIWSDECHMLVNSHDAHYLAQCRSHRGCMIGLTQSLASFYSALKGETGKHQVDALLSQYMHKVIHSLGDVQSAEYASNLIGKTLTTFHGGSMAPQDSLMDELCGRGRFTGSFNTQFEKILQDNVFLNGLRTGGKANGLLCDAIVVRSGEPFANGQNWLWTTFSQK